MAATPVLTSLPVTSVLFACTYNMIRSPMAAAMMRHYHGTRVYVDSVGVREGDEVDPFAVAVMEEIVVDPKTALVRNPSFTDYLIPTILDTPTIPVDVLELADEHAPYGLRGIGEAPTLSSTPAVLAAIRQATGLELNRTPVRPEHLTGS